MSNRKKATNPSGRPASLRDALAAKKQRTEVFNLALVESADADRAGAAYETARQQIEYIESALGAEPTEERARDQLARARASRDRAQQVLEECFFPIRLRYVGEEALDALMTAHPPTEEQQKAGAKFDAEAALPDLLEHAAIDGGMTADEWRDELADDTRWTRGDRNELRELAYRAQHRPFSDGIPSV